MLSEFESITVVNSLISKLDVTSELNCSSIFSDCFVVVRVNVTKP